MPITFPTLGDNYESYVVIFDDFTNPASATASDTQAYTSNSDGGTGTNAFQDVTGGVFNVVTAAADNDYQAMSSVAENFIFESGKRIWADFKFKCAEATTSESTWWLGFTDTLTTGGMQANAIGPLASYDGALIYKTPETSMTVNFEVSNAGTQSTASDIATAVTDTWNRAQLYHDGAGNITAHFYNGTSWYSATLPITLTGLAEMHLVFGIKAGPTAAAETLQIDWLRVVYER